MAVAHQAVWFNAFWAINSPADFREAVQAMNEPQAEQSELFSAISDVDLAGMIIDDLRSGLSGKVARFRQLADLSTTLGRHGTLIPGGYAAEFAWIEARSLFIHGNFVATILLCQALAEHLLAAHLREALLIDDLPKRINFRETVRRCRERGVITEHDANDLIRMMDLRNPLSHFHGIDDGSDLTRRTVQAGETAEFLAFKDATFSIGLAVRLLSKGPFRLG